MVLLVEALVEARRVHEAVQPVEHDVGEHADAEGFPKDPRPRHLLVVRVVDVDPQRVR